MDLLTPPPDARHVTALEGEASIWLLRPGVVVQLASGVLSLPIARGLTDFLDPILQPGAQPGARVRIFSDLGGLSHYTREARDFITAFVVGHRPAIESFDVLVTSKFNAMGLSAFIHAIGNVRVRVYSEHAPFARALAAATPDPS